jgi:hypothetical protein
MLQRICDALQPGTINVFFQRWLARLPLPLGPADQRAGYWWELSMAQVEVSRTIVFTQPRHARAFFEALVTDNLDLGRPDTLSELQDTARAINNRLLHTERASQSCVLANPVFERIAHPTVDAAGRRATAMRFGDSRVQALAGALCQTTGAVTGITSRSLRALMTGLLGVPCTMGQASYDLARLARNGLIARRPHASTYDLTPDGLAFAIFYTKVHDRVLAPLFTAGQPQAPPELTAALTAIQHHIDNRLGAARLPMAA